MILSAQALVSQPFRREDVRSAPRAVATKGCLSVRHARLAMAVHASLVVDRDRHQHCAGREQRGCDRRDVHELHAAHARLDRRRRRLDVHDLGRDWRRHLLNIGGISLGVETLGLLGKVRDVAGGFSFHGINIQT